MVSVKGSLTLIAASPTYSWPFKAASVSILRRLSSAWARWRGYGGRGPNFGIAGLILRLGAAAALLAALAAFVNNVAAIAVAASLVFFSLVWCPFLLEVAVYRSRVRMIDW